MKWMMAACVWSAVCLSDCVSAAARVAPDEWPATVITHLVRSQKVVALTFDACEAGERMSLDQSIADILIKRQIPFTIFMGGRFARDNS